MIAFTKTENLSNTIRLTDVLQGEPSYGKRWGGTKIGKYKTACAVRKDIKQMIKKEWKKLMNTAKRNKVLNHTTDDHALNINFCVWFAKSFIFTGIQIIKAGLFYKNNSVRVINRWFT